jgi:CRISPR-associated protein Csc1
MLNHDYLWFSSTEFSKRSETLPILHNYALTYSLGDYSYWQGPASPRYDADLANIAVYATPAAAPRATRTRLTYNALDDLTLRTDRTDRVRGVNTPDLGYRTYIDPVFASGRDARSPDGFLTYLFTFDGRAPKGVTRLGKKGGVWRVLSTELPSPRAVWRSDATEPSHPVNPLDVAGEVVAYEPVIIPPHLLYRRARVRADWFVFGETPDGQRHAIHVPRRVLARLEGQE